LSNDAFSSVSYSPSPKINVEYIQYVLLPLLLILYMCFLFHSYQNCSCRIWWNN
jgi:hypothetical protein